jgi:REP element-mobilizing transposase RayT
MAQSLAKIITHIVFSTKHREPVISTNLRVDLAAYIGGILRQVDSVPLGVTCMPDHVHALCCLSKNHALAHVLREIKTGSSKWMKTQGGLLRAFHWQNGYGAFSVSQSNLAAVQEYVREQEAHHHRMTFQEEFRAFLRRHEVEFDERYVWD